MDGALHAEPEDGRIGTVYQGRYRLDAHLGAGGMGAVYRATQLSVDRSVALKILHPTLATDLNEVARFQQEARAIAALQHPHAVGLIDYGQADDGSLFLVMECLEGESLGARIKAGGRFTPEQVIRFAVQVLDALDAAHHKGIVHRDIKPENLFLTRVGRRDDFVKVLDFGIAKLVGEGTDQARLTATGIAIGSPKYMSPEQARAAAVAPRSDLYSLGVVMYQMLTGRLPYRASSARGWLLAHLQGTPTPPSRDGVPIGGPLVDLIMQCLSRDPAGRPASAAALQQALEASLATGHPVELLPDGAAPADPISPSGAVDNTPRRALQSTRPLAEEVPTQTRPTPQASSPAPSDTSPPQVLRLVAFAVVLAFVLAMLEVLTGMEYERTDTPPPVRGPVASAGGAPPAPPPPTQSPSPAQADTLSVRIATTPGEATVHLEDDEDSLGAGEVVVRWPHRMVPPRVEVRCPGYQTVVRDLMASEAGTTVPIVLQAVEEAAPPTRAPGAPSRPRYDRL